MPLDSPKDKTSKTPSKSLLKRWIWVPFALIFVIAIILTQIDLDSVKENLIEKVSSETGLKVEIDSIGFGFSRGLGLQCKGVKVSTPEGDHYSVDRLDLLAAWSPLFRGEFKIKSAALEHPVIKLEIPKSKPEQPAEKEQPPEEKEKPAEKPGLVDSETIKSTTVKLESNPLSIDKFVISDGEITLTRPGSTQQLLLNIDGTFMLNRDEHLDMSAKSIKVQTGSMIFEGDGAVSRLGAVDAGLSLNLKAGNFSLKQLQPALQFFEVSMQESPLEAVNVDQLILKNKFPLNTLSNTELLMQKMTGQLELKIRNAILKSGYSIESLKGEGIWEKGSLTHDFSGTALGSDFSINGKFPFSGFDKDSISRVEWKDLELKKLPLPKETAWSSTQGTVSGKLSLTGPIPKEVDKLKGSVEFQVASLVLTPSGEGRPIEVSRLNGSGNIDQGILQHDVQGSIWGSDFDLTGKVQLNAKKSPVLDSQLNWKELDVAQLPLPPGEGWQPTQGKVSGSLTMAGPIPADGKQFSGQIKGSFNAQNITLHDSVNAKTLALNTLNGEGQFAKNKLDYKIKTDMFNGSISSNGNVTLPASGSPVLNNQIELANLDLSQLPIPTTIEKGNVSATIKLLGPLPDAKNFLTGDLKIDTSFKVTDLSMPTDAQPVNIQTLEGKTSLNKGRLTHDLTGNMFDGKLAAKGNLTFHKNNITANSNIVLDRINLNGFSQFHQSAPSSGTLSGNLKITGPLPSDGNISPDLKIKGILEAGKLVLKDNQVEKLKLDLNGPTQAQVMMETVKLGERNFKKVEGNFKISAEKIDLTSGKIWPKNGLIQLRGDFKPESGNYRLKFKGDKLKVEDLLQPPHLMGPLDLSGAIVGILPQNNAAPGLPDHARNLSGDIKITLINGAIPELGSVEGLLTLLNPTTALNAQKEGLSYDYLGGDFKIVKGVVHTDNFEMKSPQVNMNVVGKANLVEDSVLAQVKAMPLQMLDKTIKAIPLLGQILGGGKKGGLIEVYVKVDGKLSQPEFMMQPHKSLMEKPGSILKGLLNLPGNLSGGKQ